MANDNGVRKQLLNTTIVPLSEVYANEAWNAREVDGYENRMKPRGKDKEESGDGSIEGLAKDLKERGQINPIIVVACDDAAVTLEMRKKAPKGAKYFVVAGFRRVRALAMAGLQSAAVRVAAGHSTTDLLLLNLHENTARKDLTLYELAKQCTAIVDLGELSLNGCADQLAAGGGKRYSKSHVGNCVRAFKVCIPEIKAGWKAGEEWATFQRLTEAAKHCTVIKKGDKTEVKVSPEDAEEQRALWAVWSGQASEDDVEDGTESDTNEDGTVSDKPKKPSAANVESAVVQVKKIANEQESGSIEEIAAKAAVCALQWVLGHSRNGRNLPENKPLRIAGLAGVVWSTGTGKVKDDEDEADAE
jgi:ParB/RepB/Spo0J family partition protein